MLLIIANHGDEAARQLAAEWKSYSAAVLTPADLSRKGWSHCLPASSLAYAVADGNKVATSEIAGVLTRMSYVSPQELGSIVPEDRAYVAAEMNAFLAAWLSSLACPLLNRPTPGCLTGPNWRREQWVGLAARLGLPVCPVRRSSSHADVATSENIATDEVVVVGNQCIGIAPSELCNHARKLAKAAGTDLLAVKFTGPEDGNRFFNASPVPGITSPEVATAILNYMCGRTPC